MTIPVGIANHIKGDTWDGVEIIATTKDENGASIPLDITGCDIIAQFKINTSTVFEFKTSDNTILVPNPTTGQFFLAPRKMDVEANTYKFDIEVTYPDGTVETIVPAHSWTITPDVSKWRP